MRKSKAIETRAEPTAKDSHIENKRTRVLAVRQSSRGCLTCKARRIKCDETTPSCLRCQRSKRHCAGYAYAGFQTPRAIQTENSDARQIIPESESSHSTLLSIQPPAVDLNLLPWQRALAKLGCDLIAEDPHCILSPEQCLFYSKLLPIFNNTVPSVAAASAAFGAAYDARILQKGDGDASSRSHEIYAKALRSLQEEIDSPRPKSMPILLSSVLLAAYELMANRRRDALMHIQSICYLFSPGSQFREQCIEEICAADGTLRTLDRILVSLEHQAKFFALDNRLLLDTLDIQRNLRLRSLDDLVEQHPFLIHKCLKFWGDTVGRSSIEPPFVRTPATLLAQGKLIGRLTRWLAAYKDLVDNEVVEPACETPRECSYRPISPSRRLRHLAVLRAQCIGALITTSVLVPSSQLDYDKFLDKFVDIVDCARTALTSSINDKELVNRKAFSPSLGLVQVLSFTARKCRDPEIRRSAILLMLQAGQEGPFDGKIEGLLGARIVEIEEKRSFSLSEGAYDHIALGLGRPPFANTSAPLDMHSIVDEDRICGVWRVNRKAVPDMRFASLFKFGRKSREVLQRDEAAGSLSQREKHQCGLDVWQEGICAADIRPKHRLCANVDVLDSHNPSLWKLLPCEAI